MSQENKKPSNLDDSPLNPFKDVPQTPQQIQAVRDLMNHLQDFSHPSPGITSMLHCLAIFFYFDAINFCDMYLEAHDPQHITKAR